MTQQTTPLYSMTIKAGEGLIQNIERSLAAAQQAQVKTNARFQNWKAMVKAPQDPQAACLGEAGLMGFFLDFLFGMPVFSGMSEAAKGMLQVGLMAHADQGRENASAMPSMAALNALIAQQGAHRAQALHDQTAQAAEMKELKQKVEMILAMMLRMVDGKDIVASDVLRDPNYARIKQNKYTIVGNITEKFHKAQRSVLAPHFCEAA